MDNTNKFYKTANKILKVLNIILIVWAIIFIAWILNNFKEIENINMFLYIPCLVKTLMRKNNFMKITNDECNKFTQNFHLFLRN